MAGRSTASLGRRSEQAVIAGSSKTNARQGLLHSKQIERENYGTAGTSFTERQRAEYMECAEALRPFNATIRQAVNFYLPHLHASNRTCSAAQLVDELLKIKEADGTSERYLDAIGRSKAHTKLERISSKNMNERFEAWFSHGPLRAHGK